MNLLAAVASAPGAPQVGEGVTAANLTLLGLYLALAIGVSFLCSLLEAGLLSVPMSHVEVMARENRRGGKTLKQMKSNIDRPLAAILTLNTIAHTFGAAGVGAQVLKIWGSGSVAIGSIVVTLLILVFSEIIPKSLGAAKAKPFAPFTAYAIRVMIWCTWLLLLPLQWISNKLGSSHSAVLTRDEVAMTAELAHTAGVIAPDEIMVIRNILSLRQTPVSTIMTPRPVVFVLPADETVRSVLDRYEEFPYTRMPLIEQDKDHVIGYITRADLLHAKHEGHLDQTLRDMVKPLDQVPLTAHVLATFKTLIQSRHHLLRVVDEFGGTSGVVSLEDCVETILGQEIMDETDSAADLRAVAERLRADRDRK